MSGHLERRTPSPAELAHPTGATSGKATSISQLTFNQKALIYAQDMPHSFRTGVRESTELALHTKQQARSAGELILANDAPTIIAPRDAAETRRVEKSAIASGMRQLSKPRKALGRVVQRRVGWQATPDLIVITVAERELAQTDAGKYAPAGQWLIEDRRTYPEASGKATKRTGTVPMDSDSPAGDAGNGDSTATSGPEAAVARAFPEGAASLGLLPAQVRSSAIARVPSPTQFDGVVLQEPDAEGNPVSLEVNVLRMDTQRAVVIQATRGVNDSQWTVSQATYRLGEAEIEQA